MSNTLKMAIESDHANLQYLKEVGRRSEICKNTQFSFDEKDFPGCFGVALYITQEQWEKNSFNPKTAFKHLKRLPPINHAMPGCLIVWHSVDKPTEIWHMGVVDAVKPLKVTNMFCEREFIVGQPFGEMEHLYREVSKQFGEHTIKYYLPRGMKLKAEMTAPTVSSLEFLEKI